MKERKMGMMLRTAIPAVIGGTVLACGNMIGAGNHFAMAVLLIALAVVLYFYAVFVLAGKNWIDLRAVFSGVWIATIGFAALRLTEYQEPWQDKTWLLLGIAYGVFMLGATAGVTCGKKLLPAVLKKIKAARMRRFCLHLQEGRLFWICVITTLIGFACFVANVMIRGFIPCFTVSGSNEYYNFYTKFYVFAVAATGISGLCYYCLKTQKNSIIRKLVLLLCIFYSTFAFPILVVSRGTFVTSALSLATVVFYLHRRNLLVLIACLAVILGVYYAASQLRGYTDAQLQGFFEPAVITKPVDSSEITLFPEVALSPEFTPHLETAQPPEEPAPSTTEPASPEMPAFQLPPKLAFLYSYLTVGHDNFNEAVQNTVGYTYGARQLSPFNVILRSEKIAQTIASGEYYLVRNHLNTVNFIGGFYYDLHGAGVVAFMLLWSVVFGVMQASCDVFHGPFSLMMMGNTMTPVALCFFTSWMSVFSHWMHWGTVLLLALAACITRRPAAECFKA